jgi:hypothetical protein
MRRGVLVGVLLVVVLSVVPIQAQKITGDITGSVTDPSGAAIVGATVVAENTATKAKRTTTTGSEGFYRFTELQPGTYKVSASAMGFKTTQRDVQVVIGVVTAADFRLQLGSQAETITIEESVPLIELSERLNTHVDQARIENIPLSGRDFNSLLAITPGVQRAPGGGFQAVNINGARNAANNYLVDGMYNNDRYYGDSALNQTGVLGIPATLLPLDAISEFTVQQLPSAEVGVKGGASINVALKSGTNNFHGSAYYFGHWDNTDASSPITQQVTPLRNHQYGATFSGPFVKDRTFFLGFFEGQRNNSVPQYEVTLATAADVAAGRAVAQTVFAQTNPGQMCCPGDALASFFPTGPGGQVPATAPNDAKMSTYGFKIDHKLSDQHNVSGRYIIGDGTQSAPSVGYTIPPAPTNVSGLGPDGFNSFAPSRAQLAGVNWTYAISPNKILESRFGWTRFSQILGPNNKIDPRSLGIDTGPLDAADFGVPYVYMYYVNVYGYIGGVGSYPIATRPSQSFDQAEHFTWTKGSHTMKMGGNWQYANTDSLRNNARTRFFILNDSDPTNALAQLFLLKFDEAFRNFGDTHRRIYQHTLGLYWQDEWRISSRLTLNFGLRYDIHGTLGESSKLGGNFDPVLGPVRLTLQGDGGLKRIHDVDLNNFGPRAGLAWDIFGNGKTALRIGYALTYDVLNFGTLHSPRNNNINRARVGAFTNITQGVFTTNLVGDFRNFATGFSVADPTATCFDVTTGSGDFICAAGVPVYGPNPVANPFFPVPFQGVEKDLRTTMIHYFTASIQHELFKNSVLTVSYVGTQGRNLTLLRDINARPIGCRDPNTGTQLRTGACARPFDASFQVGGQPMFGSIIFVTDDGKSWYDSLQVSFRQRAWYGINTQYSLTWSHCLDYGSLNRGNRTNIPPSQNPWRPSSNKGNCDHDVPLNFNIGGTYDIPKATALGRFGEGWQIGTVLSVLDGRPFSATQGSRDRSGQDVNGTLHADCNAAPVYDTRNPDGYIVNQSDFDVATPNTIGSCGRNVFRGPGLAQWDVSLTKDTRLNENVTFQFRWEVFNVLNRANFGQPGTDVRFGGLGIVTTTPDLFNPVLSQGGPRSMQFVFRVKF